MYLVLCNFIACVGSSFCCLSQATGKFHHPEGHHANRPTVSLRFHAPFLRGHIQSHSSFLICGCSGFPDDTVSGAPGGHGLQCGDKERQGASTLTSHPCPVSSHRTSTISHYPARQILANSLGTKSQREASRTKSFPEQR